MSSLPKETQFLPSVSPSPLRRVNSNHDPHYPIEYLDDTPLSTSPTHHTHPPFQHNAAYHNGAPPSPLRSPRLISPRSPKLSPISPRHASADMPPCSPRHAHGVVPLSPAPPTTPRSATTPSSPFSTRNDTDARPTTGQKLAINDFQLLEKIGQGGFGAVYLAKKCDTEEILALKRMEKSFILSKNRERHVMNERDALVHGRDNPWLVRMIYSFQDPLNLYIAMEFVPGGDLRSLIDAVGILSEEHAQIYVAEIVESVRACHSLGYCHRDIKPENFLIDAKGHIKLADFGLSKSGVDMYLSKLHSKYPSLSNSMSDLATIKDSSGKRLAYSVVGSPCYMAPEVVQQLGYGLEADWWSVGVILFELLTGDPPFTGDSPDQVMLKLSEWQRHLKFPGSISMKAWDLIQGLIARPSARLSADQIVEHPFFDGVDWDNLREQEPPFVPTLSGPTDTSYYNTSPAERNYDVISISTSSDKSILGFSFPRNSADSRAMMSVLREINFSKSGE